MILLYGYYINDAIEITGFHKFDVKRFESSGIYPTKGGFSLRFFTSATHYYSLGFIMNDDNKTNVPILECREWDSEQSTSWTVYVLYK